MHRSIHKLWGFGQLEEWDEKPGSSPFNNRNLVTDAGDRAEPRRDHRQGRRSCARRATCRTTRRPSTSPTRAGPYPDPPREIRSANGKIYVHWRFYRDERQCATVGRRSASSSRIRPRRRQGAARCPTRSAVPRHVADVRRQRRRPERAPPAPAADDGGGPRRLQRSRRRRPAHRGEARRARRRGRRRRGGRKAPAEPRRRPPAPAGRPRRRARPTRARRRRPRAGSPRSPPATSTRAAGMAALPVQDQRQGRQRSAADLAAMLADLASEGDRRRARLGPAGHGRRACAPPSASSRPSLDDTAAAQLYSAVAIGTDRHADPDPRPARRRAGAPSAWSGR